MEDRTKITHKCINILEASETSTVLIEWKIEILSQRMGISGHIHPRDVFHLICLLIGMTVELSHTVDRRLSWNALLWMSITINRIPTNGTQTTILPLRGVDQINHRIDDDDLIHHQINLQKTTIAQINHTTIFTNLITVDHIQ